MKCQLILSLQLHFPQMVFTHVIATAVGWLAIKYPGSMFLLFAHASLISH